MNKYEKWYINLIDKGLTRNKEKEEGYELHHIIPRCLGGKDSKNNLVKLTLREHFIAHKILVKVYPDNHKLKYAVRIIFNIQGQSINRTSREYEKYKKEAENNFKNKVIVKDKDGNTFKVDRDDPRYMSGELICNAKDTVLVKNINDPEDRIRISKDDPRYNTTYIPYSKGTKASEETKKKLSKTLIESGIRKGKNNSMYGQGHKVAGDKNGMYGKQHSDETKAKQSLAKQKFIEENGTASFGAGKVYMRNPIDNKLNRVDISDISKIEKEGYTLSVNAKKKLIKQGLYKNE
jgi:hypothetical protein